MLKKIKEYISGPHELKTHEGFRTLYQEQKNFIRTSIYWMVRNQDVDDIVQEAFVKAWENRDTFKGQASLKTWLYRIAMNCAHDYYRKNLKMKDKEDDYQESIAEVGDNVELQNLITKGLEQLNWQQREAFILFYKLELGQKEIAEIQGVPVGTVKSRLSKAKQVFTEFVKEQEVTHA